jgi:sulfonate transport system permease protein
MTVDGGRAKTASLGEPVRTELAVGRRGRGSRQGLLAGSARRMLGVVCLFAVWWIVSAADLVDPRKLPSPASVLRAGADLTLSGVLPQAVIASTSRVAVGLLVGVAAGTILALVVGLYRAGENLIDSPVQMLRSLPAVALVPLFVIWLGIGETAKIALIAWATSFPIYINTLGAIRNIDARYADLAVALRLTRLQIVQKIVAPGAMPGFLVGLRYALTLAWIVLVVSEQVNAASGLGHLTAQARLFYQTDVLMVCLIVYGVLGWASDLTVRALERHLLRWRSPFPQN